MNNEHEEGKLLRKTMTTSMVNLKIKTKWSNSLHTKTYTCTRTHKLRIWNLRLHLYLSMHVQILIKKKWIQSPVTCQLHLKETQPFLFNNTRLIFDRIEHVEWLLFSWDLAVTYYLSLYLHDMLKKRVNDYDSILSYHWYVRQ